MADRYKVLNFTSWTPPMPLGNVLDPPQPIFVMAVAIETFGGKWKCYLGLALDDSVIPAVYTAQQIAGNGVKVSKSEACGMFPELPSEMFTY